MPMEYKVDVIAALKEAGFNTNKIRKEKIMGEAMLQKIRSGQMVSWQTLERICYLLDCQPGDLITYRKGSGVDKTVRKDKNLQSPMDEVSLYTDSESYD